MAEKKTTTKKTKAKYIEGIGRRKTAVARARLTKGTKASFLINDKSISDYFQNTDYQQIAQQAIEQGAAGNVFDLSIKVAGGGKRVQAEAVRHGISRALILFDETLRPHLKTLGFLTRDPRMRERKKFGLKRARRASQWRKR